MPNSSLCLLLHVVRTKLRFLCQQKHQNHLFWQNRSNSNFNHQPITGKALTKVQLFQHWIDKKYTLTHSQN